VLLVDNGGFFPEDDIHRDVSWFLMDAMKVMGTDAVGTSEKELRFGVAFLKGQVARTHLPLLSSNLFDKKTGKPVFDPYLIKKVGNVKVGIFSLISDQVDLGPAKDSLRVEEPAAAAKRTVAELHKKGATIVVLLSNLGKVESEDLATAVDGIDAVVVGRNTPLLQKGRMIKQTVTVYGGEQGQYVGRTTISLNKQGRMTTGDAETFILGPEVGEKKEMAALVKGFEDSFNEKLRKQEKEQALKDVEKANTNPDHFLGAELCMRCHTTEGVQWKTTSHARAWQTLVDLKKDATPECVGCHVLGNKQPGGFTNGTETPALVNVQCESCHGMGTQHEAFASMPRKITAANCVSCHTNSNSPTFDFATYMPHIAHQWTGEMPKLPDSPAKKLMQEKAMQGSAPKPGGSSH
jgi:Cytochrome c554 and c-prime